MLERSPLERLRRLEEFRDSVLEIRELLCSPRLAAYTAWFDGSVLGTSLRPASSPLECGATLFQKIWKPGPSTTE